MLVVPRKSTRRAARAVRQTEGECKFKTLAQLLYFNLIDEPCPEKGASGWSRAAAREYWTYAKDQWLSLDYKNAMVC
jgi:hypothetical protein